MSRVCEKLADAQALQQLQQKLQDSPHGPQDEALLKWYLRDRGFKLEEAEKKLTSMLAWRESFRCAARSAHCSRAPLVVPLVH